VWQAHGNTRAQPVVDATRASFASVKHGGDGGVASCYALLCRGSHVEGTEKGVVSKWWLGPAFGHNLLYVTY
jgi:hypothetical protein